MPSRSRSARRRSPSTRARRCWSREPDGQIRFPSEKGLYFLDTRLISAWSIYADGEPWVLLNGGAVAYYASRIFLTNGDFLTQDGRSRRARWRW